MGYKIYIADKKKKKVLELPQLPTDLPAKEWSADVEDFKTAKKGYKTIIGNRQRMGMTLEFVAPNKGHKLVGQTVKTTGNDIEKLLNSAMSRKKPIWVMIVRPKGSYYCKKLFAVSSMNLHIDKIFRYHFTLELKEWKEY